MTKKVVNGEALDEVLLRMHTLDRQRPVPTFTDEDLSDDEIKRRVEAEDDSEAEKRLAEEMEHAGHQDSKTTIEEKVGDEETSGDSLVFQAA